MTSAPLGAASGEGMEPPARVGRYEVRGELGRGMMGVVYDAYDPALGRNIALKTVRVFFGVSPADREAFEKRFFAEARIAAHLSHPGIVVVHDVGRDPATGTLYIALERLPGRTLAEIIRDEGRVEWQEAFRIIGRVALALHHAHSHGVIHRDVKPANIMILPGGEPKIMDFGIAHLETAHAKLTAPGEFLGTPLYMSPEQTLGGPLDPRTDVFSLGAIAYALITGRLAFGPGTLGRIIDRVVHENPPPPSQVIAGLPPEVDDVVARALAKTLTDRYLDARSLAEDAEDVLAGRPPRHRGTWRRPDDGAPPHDGDDCAANDRLLEQVFEDTRTIACADVESQLAGLVDPALPRAAVNRGWQLAAAALLATLAALEHHDGPIAPRPSLLVVTPPPAPAEAAVPGGDDPPPLAAPQPPGALAGRGSEQKVRPLPPAAADGDRPVTAKPDTDVDAGTVSRAALRRPSEAARATRGRLAVDFRHPLRNGKLRVWVDDELLLDQAVAGQVTKNLIGVKLYAGTLLGQVEVTPNAHRIRVQVDWDDKQKSGVLSATFVPGGTRRLQIRLRRVPRDLSLELT